MGKKYTVKTLEYLYKSKNLQTLAYLTNPAATCEQENNFIISKVALILMEELKKDPELLRKEREKLVEVTLEREKEIEKAIVIANEIIKTSLNQKEV